jgi:hypothetical protein
LRTDGSRPRPSPSGRVDVTDDELERFLREDLAGAGDVLDGRHLAAHVAAEHVVDELAEHRVVLHQEHARRFLGGRQGSSTFSPTLVGAMPSPLI